MTDPTPLRPDKETAGRADAVLRIRRHAQAAADALSQLQQALEDFDQGSELHETSWSDLEEARLCVSAIAESWASDDVLYQIAQEDQAPS